MLDFTGQIFFILSLKLSDEAIEDLKNIIRKHNGVALSCIGMERANFILTNLRSAERLERHVKCRQGVVIHVDWLNYCVAHQRIIPMKHFHIQLRALPKEIILISSDEENSPSVSRPNTPISNSPSPVKIMASCGSPMQARTMEDIGLAYCRTFSIYSQQRRSKKSTQKSLSEEEQTTTSGDNMDISSSQPSSLEAMFDATQGPSASTGVLRYRRGFACEHPVPSQFYNKELIEIFERMEHLRELDGDTFSAKSYREAVVALKCFPEELSSIKQLPHIRGIGKKITRMIEDYLRDGRVEDLELLETDQRYKVLDMFYNVHGVGFESARRWYLKGYRSLDMVVKKEPLSTAQKIGIELYRDFLEKMSRTEVEEIVATLVKEINMFGPAYEHTICGSYRRGRQYMGDIDIIFTHQDESRIVGLLGKLLDHLQAKGLVTHLLSASVHNSRMVHAPPSYNRTDQALLVWQQPGYRIKRRLDIIITPYYQYYPTILAWTGSKHFEQSLRLYAKKKKLKVVHHGVFSRVSGELIPIDSEKQVFDLLGLAYLEPDQRDF